jgi:hypothetical protein
MSTQCRSSCQQLQGALSLSHDGWRVCGQVGQVLLNSLQVQLITTAFKHAGPSLLIESRHLILLDVM